MAKVTLETIFHDTKKIATIENQLNMALDKLIKDVQEYESYKGGDHA